MLDTLDTEHLDMLDTLTPALGYARHIEARHLDMLDTWICEHSDM